MSLEIQVKLILFSFIFGAFLSLTIDVNHKYLYSKNFYFQIIFTFFFIIVNTFIYFLCLKRINEGIIHIYSIFCIIFGFFIEHIIRKKVVKLKK